MVNDAKCKCIIHDGHMVNFIFRVFFCAALSFMNKPEVPSEMVSTATSYLILFPQTKPSDQTNIITNKSCTDSLLSKELATWQMFIFRSFVIRKKYADA